jgi:hypothetical protein
MNIKNLFRKQSKIELVKEGDEEYEELCKMTDLNIRYEKPSVLIMKILGPSSQYNEIITKFVTHTTDDKKPFKWCVLDHCVNCADKNNIDYLFINRHYREYSEMCLIKDIKSIAYEFCGSYFYLIIEGTPTKEIYKNIEE